MKLKQLLTIIKISIFTFLFLNNIAQAQDFLMQGWYWDYPKTTEGANWADTLMLKSETLGNASFTYVWAPPMTRASSGNNSNGYDPKDLYDYGEYSGGATGFGARTDVDVLESKLTAQGIGLIADVVYNHRDGGEMENNAGLSDYVRSFYDWGKADAGANPYPYDRMRCILPIGGTTGNNAGDYYIKLRSASQHSKFYNWEYKVYLQTNAVGWLNLTDLLESEPNGGGGCSQPNNSIELGRNMNAVIDAGGCDFDEFHLSLSAADFDAAGDTLFIYFGKRGSGYSDMRVLEIWYNGSNIEADLDYQTYTDFSNMPSGQGAMDWSNFKPNLDRTTYLEGDWDGMYFFYDYDQFQSSTKDALIDWTEWNWNNVGVRGFRMDAVKHFTPEFVGDLLDSLHDRSIDPGIVIGEWYSTNTAELSGWVNDVLSYMEPATKAAINPRIFDFALRENLRKACDDGSFDARNVFAGSIVDATSTTGFNVVTFLNNHDFRDNSGFASLIHNESILGYAYLLTNNKLGVPLVFYPDYFGYQGGESYYPTGANAASPLKTEINQLIQLHKKYIYGATSVEYLNRFSTPRSSSYFSGSADKSLIYQISGGMAGKEVIVAINFSSSTLKVDHEINLINGLVVGSELADITGNSAYPYAVVSGSNQIYMELPPRSWSVWVQGNPVEPLAPSALKIESASDARFAMSWVDNSPNESNFVLERKTGAAGSWTSIASPVADTAYHIDSASFNIGTTYFYRIKSTNTAGDSDYSNEVSSKPYISWQGFSTNWNDNNNWMHFVLPDSTCDVLVPAVPEGGNFPSAITGDYGKIRKLKLESGSELDIPAGKVLEVIEE